MKLLQLSLALIACLIAPWQLANAQDQTSLRESWLKALKSGDTAALEKHYHPEAYAVSEEGYFIQGSAAIAEKISKENWSIVQHEHNFSVTAHQSRGIKYHLDALWLGDKGWLQLLSITEGHGADEKIVLEMIVPTTFIAEENFLQELEERRELWMEKCNAHAVEDLVNSLYTDNTMYYNHRPMVQGHETLSSVYQYMARPSYSLQLEPLHLLAVHEGLVFEIGQCSGSYPGKYILVWVKTPSGEWKILLDSNV